MHIYTKYGKAAIKLDAQSKFFSVFLLFPLCITTHHTHNLNTINITTLAKLAA